MTPLTAEQQALAADPANVDYALAVGRRWGRRRPQLADEFESAALVGLVHAARTFDASFGTNFRTTHLPRHVAAALIDACRAWEPKGFRRPRATAAGAGPPRPRFFRPALAAPAEAYTDQALSWDKIPGGDLPVGWEAEAADEVLALARSLPARYAELLGLHHLHAGMTAPRIAAALGVTVAAVYWLLRRAHRWLAEGRVG